MEREKIEGAWEYVSEGRLSRCESKHARKTGVKVHVHPPLHQNITRANEFIDGLVEGEGATELLTKGTIHAGRLAHPGGSPQRSASRDRQQEDGKKRGTGIEETPLKSYSSRMSHQNKFSFVTLAVPADYPLNSHPLYFVLDSKKTLSKPKTRTLA